MDLFKNNKGNAMIVSIVIVVLIIIFALLFVIGQKNKGTDEQQETNDNAMMEADDSAMTGDDAMMDDGAGETMMAGDEERMDTGEELMGPDDDAMMGDEDMMMEEEGDVMVESEVEVEADIMAEDNTTASVQTFEVNGFEFGFSRDEIRVKKGDKVKIVFTSTGGFHDWVVDEFSAATKQVHEGETSVVEFVADKQGTFEFYCSVGQHRKFGMVGNLIVE